MNNRPKQRMRNTPTQLADMSPQPGAAPAANSSRAIGPTGDPTMGPLVVTAYSGRERGSLLLNLAEGKYHELAQFYSVTPSPDGTRALVYTGPPKPRFGVRNSVTKVVSLIDGGYRGTLRASTAGWSRDGQEILITESTQDRSGFAIVDATTLRVSFVPHDGITALDGLGLRYVWTPDGNQIALTQSRDPDSPTPPRVTCIRFYDRTGELVRELPATAALTRESAFSPDRGRIALQTDPPFGESIEIVSAIDGRTHQTLRLPEDQPSPRWLQLVGWADDDHLIVRDYVSRGLWIVVVESAEFRAVVLPNVGLAEELHIGSTEQLNQDAHELTFGPEWPPLRPDYRYAG